MKRATRRSGVFFDTLWDLLANRRPERSNSKLSVSQSRQVTRPNGSQKRSRPESGHGTGRRPSMQARYDALVIEMKSTYGFRIRRWRRATTGCAYLITYRDGSIARLVESPYPTGPVSCAVFLHEVGHHAIGFGVHRPRCLEEYHAWRWSLEMMERKGFRITAAVERRMDAALRYAVEKAVRRGIRRIPPELREYV